MDGLVGTEAAQGLAERARGRTSLGRVAPPEDVASVVAFLSGDETRRLTGVLIPVEAGALL